MDVGSVSSSIAYETDASAWADAMEEGEVDATIEPGATAAGLAQATDADAPHPLAPAGLGEPLLEEPHTGLAATPTRTPGPSADHSLESANLQTFARPHAPVAEPLRPTDTALPSAAHARSEFALPADQLIPVTLIGLQVEPAGSWPLLRRGFDAPVPELPRGQEPPAPLIHDEADGHDDDGDAAQAEPADTDVDGCGLVFDEPDAGDWCEPLTRALREALAVKIPPQALLAAAEQWRRGRCVVLACPQGADPAGPGWAFVLWPRVRAGVGGRPESGRGVSSGASSLALFGLRVEARLQWSAPPRNAQWCHVRVVKEHHPRRGRQLIALDRVGATPAASAAVQCEVQLGPVLARSLHWCEVCVRINAVRRFWAALGGQWSVSVVVCSLPLAGTRAPNLMEASC